MHNTAFIKIEFFAWVGFALVFPLGIYSFMMMRRTISRGLVLLFGVMLVALAGASVVLMPILEEYARLSSDLLDNRLFNSEFSLALYLLPAVFAGLGTNIISHVLIQHLAEAEARYDRAHPDPDAGRTLGYSNASERATGSALFD
ncbi:MAG: hypothetical protein KBE19_03780 [Rhodocyclaceae bacterium]|nr:hypothetical protein [Rhodocyclaceae bacterium]